MYYCIFISSIWHNLAQLTANIFSCNVRAVCRQKRPTDVRCVMHTCAHYAVHRWQVQARILIDLTDWIQHFWSNQDAEPEILLPIRFLEISNRRTQASRSESKWTETVSAQKPRLIRGSFIFSVIQSLLKLIFYCSQEDFQFDVHRHFGRESGAIWTKSACLQ